MLDALKAMIKSRKFQAAIVSALVTLVVTLVPFFEPMEDQLLLIVAGFVAYILGTAGEDIAKISKGTHVSQEIPAEAKPARAAKPKGK